MTLLSLAQSIIKEDKDPAVPTTIIGNDASIAAQQALSALTNSITDLARDYDWQELIKTNTFVSVASQEAYTVPSDFDRISNNTLWNVDTMRAAYGPIDQPSWMNLKYSSVGGGATADYFRIRDSAVEIFPTPAAVVNYVYEYITNLIVDSSGGTGQTTWLADTDVPVIDSYILKLDATWRYKKNQGNPYAEEKAMADKAIEQKISASGGRKTIRHYSKYRGGRVGYPNIVVAP